MTETLDCAVIGAGVIGLAVARALAQRGRDVVVLESQETIGTGTSSRNSEVIHAGIYYPKDSLKARFCVAGRRALYGFCREHGVAHQQCGKLIVACDDADMEALPGILDQARDNGVEDLEMLDRRGALGLEANLDVKGALLSPHTGIVDSHGFMLALQGEAEDAGAMIAFWCPVIGGKVLDTGVRLEAGGNHPLTLDCRTVVNCAGMWAQKFLVGIGGMPEAHIVPGYMAKGSYFSLRGRAPFSRLIYPVPRQAAGLGVHLTINLGGQARFGPDLEWIEEENYDVELSRAEGFYAAVRRYWPGLKDGALYPDYAGIRPTVHRPGQPRGDFVLQGPADHGVNGLINLFGIESPGLTAALAIAEAVATMTENTKP